MSDTWSWVQLSDIHLGSPRSFRFEPAWCDQFEFAVEQIHKLDAQPDFILVSGDMCRDGDSHIFELEAAFQRLQQLPWPVYCLPGNHDVGGRCHPDSPTAIKQESLDRYRQVFGSDYHLFRHGDLRFLCLNSMLFGSGLEAEQEQWQWIEEQCLDSVAPTLVFMHSLPFAREVGRPAFDRETEYGGWYGTIPVEDQVRLTANLKSLNLIAVTCGHVHVYDDQIIDGMRRVLCPSTAFLGSPDYLGSVQSTLGFLEWQAAGTRISARLHQLAQRSSRQGYGSGGNIPHAERDYSLAWEH